MQEPSENPPSFQSISLPSFQEHMDGIIIYESSMQNYLPYSRRPDSPCLIRDFLSYFTKSIQEDPSGFANALYDNGFEARIISPQTNGQWRKIKIRLQLKIDYLIKQFDDVRSPLDDLREVTD